MSRVSELFQHLKQIVAGDPILALENERYRRDHEALQKLSVVEKAMYVLSGRSGEPQMSPLPAYYKDLGPRMVYYIGESEESVLVAMFRRITVVAERYEAAEDFARMIFDMPSLPPARVVEAVYGLALNDWHYTETLGVAVKKDGAAILTEDQWRQLEAANPYRDQAIRPRISTELYGTLEIAANQEARLHPKDQTEEIKAHFRKELLAFELD